MRYSKTKSWQILSKTLPFMLIFAITFVSLFSVLGISTANAADSRDASAEGEHFYLNTSLNTEWEPDSNEELVALFSDSQGNVIGEPKSFTAVSGESHLFETASPVGAVKLQIVLKDSDTILPNTIAASGSRRVFFKNNANWSTPYVYSWKNTAVNNGSYPGKAMTNISGTSYWYYDVSSDHQNLIFNDGTGQTALGVNKTGNLTLPSVDNSLYEWNLSDTKSIVWNDVPYILRSSAVDFSARTNGENTFYMNSMNECVLSKYAYPAYDNVEMQTVYLQNANWASAYVKYDLSDPYVVTVAMTKTTLSGEEVFAVAVPKGAELIFKPNQNNDYGASSKTTVPEDLEEPCYEMTNSSQAWHAGNAMTGIYDYSVGHNFAPGIYAVDATYYDYLSDAEMSNGWLNPIQAGTGFSGSSDDWFPFDNFNAKLADVAAGNPSWITPLYVGNFCNTDGAYKTSSHGARGGGYDSEAGNLIRFNYAANNSNGLVANAYDYSVRGLVYDKLDTDQDLQAINGLKMPFFDNAWLNANSAAKIIKSSFPMRATTSNGVTTYSFDSTDAQDNVFFAWDGTTPTSVNYGSGTTYGVKDGIAQFMNGGTSGYGIFPFNNATNYYVTNGQKGIYYYDVPDTYDRVIFRNPSNFSDQYPAQNQGGVAISDNCCFDVNSQVCSAYSYGVTPSEPVAEGYKRIYVVTDGTKWSNGANLYFYNSNNESQNTGWNNSVSMTRLQSANTGDKVTFNRTGNNNLDYGFGIRLDLDFRVPEYGTVDGTPNGDPVEFNYSGDDDLWLFITDPETGESKLALDLGGDHKQASGSLNFKTMVATINKSVAVNTAGDTTHNWGIDSQLNRTSNFGLTGDGTELLDPNKLYHMTIFYMERGLIESNLSFSFTMTPASNDLKIDKTVNTADVNPALAEDLAKTQDFTFTPAEDGLAVTDKAYTLNGSESLVCSGNFTLRHGDTADFNNQFKTGSTISVTEEKPSGVSYETSWVLTDNKTGSELKSGTDVTSEFVLEDPRNTDDYASLQLSYTNTPKTGDLVLKKDVVDESGSASIENDETFEFYVSVDLSGGANYQSYPLKYQIKTAGGSTHTYNATSEGLITFKKGDTVTLMGLPAGASYQITESSKPGYLPYKVSVNGLEDTFSGAITGTVPEGTDTIEFINRQNPSNAEIQAGKTLDGEAYSGSKFSFVLSGLPAMEIPGTETSSQNISGQEKTVNTVENGTVTFRNDGTEEILRFNEPGIYRYKLTESSVSDTDYSTDSKVYLAEITVTGSGSELIPSDPVYYRTDSSVEIQDDTEYAQFFADAYKMTAAPVFENTVQKGSVTVIKENQSGDKLAGTSFALYKTTGDQGAFDETDPYMTAQTDETGKAEFKNIQIFQDGYTNQSQGEPAYQWYCLVETDPADGYTLNQTKIYFTLPVSDAEGLPHYDVTYTYVNGKLIMPDASGSGMNPFYIAGLCVLAAGVLLAGSFVFFGKISRRKQAAMRYKAGR